MDYILALLSTLIADEQAVRITFVVLTGLSILIFALASMVLLSEVTSPLRRRIDSIIHREPKTVDMAAAKMGNLSKVIDPVSKYVMPSKAWELSSTSKKLVHAGYRSASAVKDFYAIKVLLAIVLPVCVLMVVQWLPELSRSKILFWVLLASFTGLMIPTIVLERLVAKRMNQLRNSFPDALDLLVVCVESGLGLTAAIQRVADELEVSHPELAEELALIGVEIRAGVSRVAALRNMSERTGLDDIRGMVALLDQSVRFGTSIADTLRVYSEEFRDKRMQKAEESAAKIGTKLIFPLTFCIWPSFFLVAIGPAILRVFNAFGAG